MMAPEYYTFTGQRVPDHVTHVRIDRALKFVPARSFLVHPNIEEVICHDGVAKIEEEAFKGCPSLRRVIMPGVAVLEKCAFCVHVSMTVGINCCGALTYIECDKLESIGEYAFSGCKSLRSVNMPSAATVMRAAFAGCRNLTHASFGKNLESLGALAFHNCRSLKRIALPLRDGIITDDDVFRGCEKLNQVDLVGGVDEIVAALLLEEWKNDTNEEIDTINRILPNTPYGTIRYDDPGGKAQAIQSWTRSVLRKVIHYKAEHRRYLNMAAALEPALPNDIVLNNILPFLAYTLGEED